MKFTFVILIFFFLLAGCGCDPDRNTGNVFRIMLNGTVNDTNENITLGDTIKFELILSPNITATNLNGDIRNETVNSLQWAFYTFHLFRVDTINHRVYSYTGDSMKINYTVNPGYQINPCLPCYGGNAYLRNNFTPYMCTLNMIPQAKGIFYFQIDIQEGTFKINNNFEGLLSAKIDVANKHLELVDMHIPGFANAVTQSGMSVYCFRVY